jgi:hypothetical protein
MVAHRIFQFGLVSLTLDEKYFRALANVSNVVIDNDSIPGKACKRTFGQVKQIVTNILFNRKALH